MTSNCPECDLEVPVEDGAYVTSIVICPACQSELEVVDLEPLLLALAPEIEEDIGE